MKIIRLAAMVIAGMLLIAAGVSYVVQFKRIEYTTSFLAGGAMIISILLVATRSRGDSEDRK
jgi:hypothetical protein